MIRNSGYERTQSNNLFNNTSSNLNSSGFFESIKQDASNFAALATDKPEQTFINRPEIRPSTAQNFHTNKPEWNPTRVQNQDKIAKLKMKEKRLEQTIQKLRQQNKDNHKSHLNKKQAEQLMHLRRQNQQLKRQLFQAKNNVRAQSQKRIVSTLQKQKIADLLKVVQKYKSQAFLAQQQLKRYQQSDHYQQKSNQLVNNSGKKSKYHQTPISNSQYINELSVIKQRMYESPSSNIEMNRLKQQNIFLQSQISKLNTQISTKNLMQDEIYQLKLQNQRLQTKLIRMSESPIFGGMNQRLQQQTKLKSLQDKLKVYNQKIQREKQKVIKLQTQLKLTQKQLVDANYQSQTNQNQYKKVKEKIKQHPILDVIVKDQTMLYQVIGYLQAQNYRSDILGEGKRDNNKYKRDSSTKIQTLISQNELLALQLTKNQTMLKTLKQIYQQHQKVRQLQQKQFYDLIQQKDKRINQLAVLSGQKDKIQVTKNGVKYQDDVSIFSYDDRIVQQPGINYFDFYLAQINLVDTFVRQLVKLADVSKIMNFGTVDFYNHQTQNTKVASGLRYNMNSQFSFKIVEDECLFNFFEKGQVSVNIWTTDGGKTILLGQAKISLKPMINIKTNVAPVMRSSVPLYLNNRSIGSLNFVMRMRYPLYKLLSQIRSNVLNSFNQTSGLNIGAYQTKQLVVKIEGAEGLPMNVSSFVYYTINNNDYYTQPLKGSHPLYEHLNMLTISYTPQFEQFIKRGQLQFTVIDDDAPTYDASGADVIGVCKINLSKLLFHDGRISEALNIINRNGQIKGILTVRIFWSQKTVDNRNINNIVASGMQNLFTGSFGKKNENISNMLASQTNQLMGNNFGGNTFGNNFGGNEISNSNTLNMDKMLMSNNGMTNTLANGLNRMASMSSKRPSAPYQINQYILSNMGSMSLNELYSKFDDNGTGVISKNELKQGLAAYFNINLGDMQLNDYFNSFQKPITQDSLQKALGLKQMNTSIQKKSSFNESKKSNAPNSHSIQDLNNYLREYMTSKNLNVQQFYRLFDDNKTDIITKEQLKVGLRKLVNLRLSQTQLQTYFRSFKMPIGLQSFKKVFGNTSKNSMKTSKDSSNQQSLKDINKLVQKNTSFLKKISLNEYLKDKNIYEISSQIDKNNNGTITKKQIQKYLQQNGLQTDDVLDDKISVVQFLKKHSEQNNIRQSKPLNIPRTNSFIV